VISNPNATGEPWQTLGAIRAQAAMVRSNAVELEHLGLALSGRVPSAVEPADLVSYMVWISLLSGHTAQVMATWGLGLVAYVEDAAITAGMTPTAPTAPPDPLLTQDAAASTKRSRRWWRWS
jgi:hypothetical protein